MFVIYYLEQTQNLYITMGDCKDFYLFCDVFITGSCLLPISKYNSFIEIYISENIVSDFNIYLSNRVRSNKTVMPFIRSIDNLMILKRYEMINLNKLINSNTYKGDNHLIVSNLIQLSLYC